MVGGGPSFLQQKGGSIRLVALFIYIYIFFFTFAEECGPSFLHQERFRSVYILLTAVLHSLRSIEVFQDGSRQTCVSTTRLQFNCLTLILIANIHHRHANTGREQLVAPPQYIDN